jgi:hypothetical protein
MRILRLLAALLMPLMVTLAIAFPEKRTAVWAQLPPGNPYLAPTTPPSGPPQLAQPVATTGIPPLAIIPSPPAPSPSATPRAFNCSCFGPGSGTHWMGTVTSSSYFAARQSASTACVSYNQLKQPQPPNEPEAYATALVAPPLPGAVSPAGAALVPPALPGATLPTDAAASPELSGVLNFSTAAQQQMCSQCACD